MCLNVLTPRNLLHFPTTATDQLQSQSAESWGRDKQSNSQYKMLKAFFFVK